MNVRRDLCRCATAFVAASGTLAPALAAAQAAPAPGAWRYSASLYFYLPSVSGTSSTPADSSGTPINVDVGQLFDDSLKFTLMGSLGAHNGRWGAFTDLVYVDFGESKQQSRDFTIGDIGIPASTAAGLDWDLKGLALTVGGEYRVVTQPAFTIDILAGARLLDLKTTTHWSITGDLGPILPPGRTGSSQSKVSLWDGIVGVKGRMALGSSGLWSVPFYLDVGTGESDLTWQAAGGISYAFNWGELTAMWRHLDYEMKSGESIKDLSFNGPLIGATFRW